MKKSQCWIMHGFIKKVFMVLLTGFVNVSSHTKCVSLNNQQF